MEMKNEKTLVAPCGLYCGACVLYKNKETSVLSEEIVAKAVSKKNAECPGCRIIKGKCLLLEGSCETYTCISKRGIDFCFQCEEFPCDKLNPTADKAATLPHNVKVYNLCYIKQHGLSKWLEKADEIQDKYYHGKMKIGKGPQML